MANYDQSCWLCKEDVSSGLMKHKRRKLRGKSCKDAMMSLEKLAYEYLDVDLTVVESYKKAPYVCHKCVSKLELFESRQIELVKMREQIVEMIEKNCEDVEEMYELTELELESTTTFGAENTDVSADSETPGPALVSLPQTTPTSTRYKRQASAVTVSRPNESLFITSILLL